MIMILHIGLGRVASSMDDKSRDFRGIRHGRITRRTVRVSENIKRVFVS